MSGAALPSCTFTANGAALRAAWVVMTSPQRTFCPSGPVPLWVQASCGHCVLRDLQDRVAEKILEGSVKDGDTVKVSAGKFDNGADRLIFEIVGTPDSDESGSEQVAA